MAIVDKELIAKELRIDIEKLDCVVLDSTRFLDKKITKAIQKYKEENNVKLTTPEKEQIRRELLGYSTEQKHDILFEITKDDLEQAYKVFIDGYMRDPKKVSQSIKSRLTKHDHTNAYLEYIKEQQKNEVQLFILNGENKTTEEIFNIVSQEYKLLSNYHKCVIVFGEDSDWLKISKVLVYMENFLEEDNFDVFNKRNKQKQIQTLAEYAKDILTEEDCKKFYKSVSYGYLFEDLYIAEQGKQKILVMQKVELDNTPKKCPSCLSENVRGNSYPKVLYKSFECSNPECSARSKIGRGKRFSYFNAKCQTYLSEGREINKIPDDIAKKYRKDVLDNKAQIKELVRIYAWAGDVVKVLGFNDLPNSIDERIITTTENKTSIPSKDFNDLPIIKLFTKIVNNTKPTPDIHCERGNVVNTDSSNVDFGDIDCAITSPPYYNARDYSQWPNLICYFVDMIKNAKNIYNQLNKNGFYLYNIADIIGQDNVYINSQMSKRRIPLGCLSMLMFNLIGYSIQGNYIWNKGEVECKRNASPNRFTGYFKPITCYEHCILFSKSEEEQEQEHFTEVVKIKPVFKINSKGENNLGHTAPYPVEIPMLIERHLKGDARYLVVDPFLGSGTTIQALRPEGFEVSGAELNKEYYDLILERVGL